ncbi:YozE family protein [Streptomyces sp. NPDC005474]|uniref:YozE family protein n=1 Tax=Streptomyces sp. NPDC005474 TaxID=3154878 RepID=UPI0034557A9D
MATRSGKVAISIVFFAETRSHRLTGRIGDLARDVSADPDRPSRKRRQGRLDYLEERGAIDAAIEILERAWTQYEVYRAAQTE